MSLFMNRIKLIFTDIVVWILNIISVYGNPSPDECPEHVGFPIYVIYINGEIEVLPLEREVKIGLDGTIYFKDPVKNKWIPYPDIVELVFTASRMEHADVQ